MKSHNIYQLVRSLRSTTVIMQRPISPMLTVQFPPRIRTNQLSSQIFSRAYRTVSLCSPMERQAMISTSMRPRYQFMFLEREGSSARAGVNSSDDVSPSTNPPPRMMPLPGNSKPPGPPKKPMKKVSNFAFSKFFTFVQGYQDMMEKRFPEVMKVSRIFFVGFKEFSKELAEYVKIKTKSLWSSDGLLNLTKEELDVYYRMPGEIFRVGPTLLLSALPGFQYIIFPIAYKFPRTLLSSHFWSLQQKHEFVLENHKKRLLNQRPVFRHLQSHVETVSDEKLRNLCVEVLFKLGSGSHPSTREIMKIKPLFESYPYSIKAMHGPHIKSLCRFHGLHTGFFKRKRLFDRAEMLYVMDVSMIREGILNLKVDDLKAACFLRGLNAANTKNEDMVEYLQQWASISSAIRPHSYSLLLHLPVLLAYNNPNNWALLS